MNFYAIFFFMLIENKVEQKILFHAYILGLLYFFQEELFFFFFFF